MPAVPEAPSIRFTRRELLRRAGVAALSTASLPALLAACGAGGQSHASVTDSPTTTPSTPGPPSVAGTIDFHSWEGYELTSVAPVKRWMQSNHVTMHASYIASQDDITALFTTGGGRGSYNLSTYEAGYSQLYQHLGIPTALDPTQVPHFAAAYQVFRTGTASTWFRVDSIQYGFPFTWGIQGINYESSKVAPPISYRDLLQPSFKGRFGITDDPVAIVVIGAHVLGFFRTDSLYTHTQLGRIMGFWRQLKARAKLIVASYSEMGDLLASGEIVAGTPGWAAVNSFAADKGDDAVLHTVPEEGGATFCDAYMIPAGAADTDTVYAFIDEAFTPQAQAAEAAYLTQGAVVPEALDLMDDATRALYPYGQVEELFTTSAPLEAIPTVVPAGYANHQDWVTAWQAVKG